MLEKINKKIEEEIEKLLDKEDLTIEEVSVLLSYKNEIKFDEKMKKMVEFAI